MNRRQAIFSIAGLSILAAGTAAGIWKFWKLYKTPQLSDLEQHKALIAEIAETIIPETDTPGAKRAQVADFIIRMVRDCTERKEQNIFLYGLMDVDAYAAQHYGKSYIQCNTGEKESILTHFENLEASGGVIHKIKRKLSGESFMYMFKNYTVIGYCTSELGATQGLAYDYIPSVFEACIPLKQNQKSWATK